MPKEAKTTKVDTKASDEAKKADAKATSVAGFNLEAAVEDYRANTPVQDNGIRHVDKDFMSKRLTTVHGVDMEAVHKYHTAMIDERSAIAEATERDLGDAVAELKKADDHEAALKAATASTSFWRHDGNETLTVIAHDESGDSTVDEGGNVVPVTKHGRIRTSISGSDGIHRKTVDDVAKRVAAWF